MNDEVDLLGGEVVLGGEVFPKSRDDIARVVQDPLAHPAEEVKLIVGVGQLPMPPAVPQVHALREP